MNSDGYTRTIEHGKKLVDTEGLRKSYRPERIIVLLVGEAPPPNGTFFYKCDSNLFRYTKEAFATAFNLQFNSDTDFLTFFRGRGFFLDDLRLQPITGLIARGRDKRPLALWRSEYKTTIRCTSSLS